MDLFYCFLEDGGMKIATEILKIVILIIYIYIYI